MKKLLGRSKSGRKSPTPSEMSTSSGNYNPYTMYRDTPETVPGGRNPYAMGSNTFNSVPSSTEYSPYKGSNSSQSLGDHGSGYSNPYERSSPPSNPYDTRSAIGSNHYSSKVTAGSNPYSSTASNSGNSNLYGGSASYDSSSIYAPPSYSSQDKNRQYIGSDNDSIYSTDTSKPYGSNDDTVSVMENKQELFKGMRRKPKPQVPPSFQSAPRDYDPSIMETEEERALRHGEESSYGGNGTGGYQVFDPVQEEGVDDTEIQAIKEQMKYVKKESLSSAQRARRYAEEAEASGLRTLQMLGEQGDQIANAEGSMAITENNTKLGEDYARELKTLNRSMFAVHVSNPFNSRRRIQEKEQKIRETFHNQQLQREENRRNQYQAQQRVAAAMGNIPGERRRQLTATEVRYREQMARQKADLAQASRFQFEPDDEDFEVERDIEATLDDVSAAANRLNSMARSINTELESQNHRVAKLNQKTQEVEIGVHLNTSRLARIR
ncbi:uncharacterized protein V1513DRAFT_443518 [Lipomyces chichibuensis]|uniref:uncharacterized protein n=1 Tax=Lipomyces chichibuensis TaxID=1546026 RepID=UPI0033431FFF